MKVVIGNKVFDPEEEPVFLVLEDEDKVGGWGHAFIGGPFDCTRQELEEPLEHVEMFYLPEPDVAAGEDGWEFDKELKRAIYQRVPMRSSRDGVVWYIYVYVSG